eukprot:CAMPEP_0181107916 /NCGR_PEP_ID=MMETSP1071-20121207/17342_1 /TAXON_ID=35127 /ORGANISM="Thalassiosira sp., Strain NH16" /LENGTH=589 /DNA_ID=CAMNT_0023191465 /DNA_START=321 /DNA_END=2090 /DNA_ORIENTATION=-
MPPFFDVHGDPNMDPYTILSLPPTASEVEIKKAYRMQMLQLHPDKLSPTLGEDSIAAVTEKFHNVKDAYEFLISPVHLTSRRLYMAKMASRRAEYERREAYIRRNGPPANNTGYSQHAGGVSGYARGGGGAAGMAGTGMEPPSSQSRHSHGHNRGHGRNASYPVPPSKNTMNRSKSEPVFDRGGGGKVNDRDRRSSGNYKNMGRHNNNNNARGRTGGNAQRHTTSRQRDCHNRGYKSDSHAAETKAKSGREDRGRSNKPRGNKHSAEKEKNRQRGKSEPRQNKGGETRQTNNATRNNNKENRKSRNNRDDRFEEPNQSNNQRESRRNQRAKSAPARYAKNKQSNVKYDKHNPSLPKEFFCPLTKRLMKDPVVDTEGNSYEREAIERWLRVQSSSPINNGYLSMDMLRPDKQLKRAIHKATGKPRSKSQTKTKRSSSPAQDLVSGRVLIDSYLREISSKSKLSVSLDGMGVCAFAYRRITFVIEVPITPHAGFMVYSSFDGACSKSKLAERIDAWNIWLSNIGRQSRVSYVKAGQKTVFTLKGNEGDMGKCDAFQKTLEYFVEMSLKLHNILHPHEAKAEKNVCLTRSVP